MSKYIVIVVAVILTALSTGCSSVSTQSSVNTADLNKPIATGDLTVVSKEITITRGADGKVISSTEKIITSAKSEEEGKHEVKIVKASRSANSCNWFWGCPVVYPNNYGNGVVLGGREGGTNYRY